MKNTKQKEIIGTVLVIIAGILWGVIGIFVRRFTVQGISSMQVSALRLFFAAALLALFCVIVKRDAFRFRLKDIWCFLCSGMLCLGACSCFYFYTMEISSMAVASILMYTSPVFVMLFSLLFFRERMTCIKVAACILALLGCAFVTGFLGSGRQNIPLIGLFTGLSSGIAYALYSIFGTIGIKKGYSSLTVTLYTLIFSALGLVMISDVPFLVRAVTKSSVNLLTVLLFAFLCTILPYLLYTVALTMISPGKAAIIASVEPVVAAISGFLCFSERLGLWGIFGIVLVISAIVLLNLPETNQQKNR